MTSSAFSWIATAMLSPTSRMPQSSLDTTEICWYAGGQAEALVAFEEAYNNVFCLQLDYHCPYSDQDP